MFKVKVRHGFEYKYDMKWWSGEINVYDVKYSSNDEIYFLISNPMYSRWQFVPADHFEPLED